MNDFMWFCLKQSIRLRYRAPCIPSDSFQRTLELQRPGDWLILDARTAAEFKLSGRPGVVRLAQVGETAIPGPQDQACKEQPIVVCCSVGLRSTAVVNQLRLTDPHLARIAPWR